MRLTHFFAIISAAFMAAVSGILIADEPVSDENSCYVDGLSDRLRCGYITVAENPQKPNGRRIQIHFVVIPAIKNIYPDQAFLAISGGPGQSAIDQAPVFERAFGKVRQQRDILLIDQRGTGRSNILECNEDEIISPLEFAYEEIASADESITIEGQHPVEIRVQDTGDHAVEWSFHYYTKSAETMIKTRPISAPGFGRVDVSRSPVSAVR